MPREITSHIVNPANDQIAIDVMDEPGSGGANHEYLVTIGLPGPKGNPQQVPISFQNGPIADRAELKQLRAKHKDEVWL